LQEYALHDDDAYYSMNTSKRYSLLIIACIVISVLADMLTTVPEYSRNTLQVICVITVEVIATAVFTYDYVCRGAYAWSQKRYRGLNDYCTSFYGTVDVISALAGVLSILYTIYDAVQSGKRTL
jgi:hypothetical protein